jgi:hypothetical protein
MDRGLYIRAPRLAGHKPDQVGHSRYVISASSQTTTVAAVLATASFVSSVSIFRVILSTRADRRRASPKFVESK